MMRSSLPIRILVAEDDADDRLMIQDAFEESRLGNPVDFVEDGMQLMEYLNRQGEYAHLADHPYPGFILLDLNMPGVTGRDVLRAVRVESEIKTPIVVLSTSTQRTDIDDSYALHANAYIVKPYGLDEYDMIAAGLHNFWHVLAQLPGEARPG